MYHPALLRFAVAERPVYGGARSSAGEHFGDIEGVVGSIPTAPTIFPLYQKYYRPSLVGRPLGNVRVICVRGQRVLIEQLQCSPGPG